MLKFTSHIIMMLSVGVVLYLAARTLPRIDDTVPRKTPIGTHVIAVHLERADEKIKKLLESILSKFRIRLTKLEHTVDKKITKLKEPPAKTDTGIFTVKEEGDSKEK